MKRIKTLTTKNLKETLKKGGLRNVRHPASQLVKHPVQ